VNGGGVGRKAWLGLGFWRGLHVYVYMYVCMYVSGDMSRSDDLIQAKQRIRWGMRD